MGQCQGHSQSLIAIHPSWYEDRNNKFLNETLFFKTPVGSVDSWVSQCIPPHGESEKTPIGEVHVHN